VEDIIAWSKNGEYLVFLDLLDGFTNTGVNESLATISPDCRKY
jgi:fructose-1,6-bisphosphatase